MSGSAAAGVSGTTPGVMSAASAMSAGANTRSVDEFQGDDIGQVLRLLARQAGINLVISDQVQGTITMRLENVTPMQAIGVIVDAKSLVMDQKNGVYFIKTAAEKQREPTKSEHYTFSYAQAEKVLPLLATQLQSGVAPQFDQRTNTVYYREFESNLDKIKLFLDSVDRPTQQVMIEARLVEVNANPNQSYGINWGGVFGSTGAGQTFQYGGSGLATYGVQPSSFTDPTTGLPYQVPVLSALPLASQTLMPFLRAGQGAGFLSALSGQFAILSAPQMSLTMRLLNEDTDAEFLANPRIVTANNLKANIKIVRNQPVPNLNFNEQTATAVFGGFNNVSFGNTLSVTPTINKDDFVTLLVEPEISNKVADQTFQFQGATVTSPIIDTRSLQSTVLIHSGDTLAIGGLLQDETSKTRTKVPVFGDIPVLGYAFQDRANVRTKRNLLVFVTPTVIHQGYGTGLEDQVSGLKYSGEEYADPNGWRNNAKGAIRLVPTSNRSNAADYPKPGTAPQPETMSTLYKVSAPSREK